MKRRLNFFEPVMMILCVIPCFGGTLDSTREVVFPRVITSRSTSDELLLVINEEHRLNLKRSTVFSDSVTIIPDEGNEPIANLISGDDLNKEFFHDPDKMASVFLSQGENVQVEGILSATRAIKPLTAPQYPSEGREAPHLLYEINQATAAIGSDQRSSPLYASLPFESNVDVNIQERSGDPSTSNIDTIYPGLFLVVDLELQNIFKNVTNALKYFGVVLNSVNLMMCSLTEPRVQMRLCGLQFATKEMEDVIIKRNGSESKVDGDATLRAFMNYTDCHPEYANYSYVYLVTKEDLTTVGEPFGQNLAGITYLGGHCTKYKVGVYEDNGYFRGTHILAHELGHSLGCPHDGDNSTIPGAPGSTECKLNDGYVMGTDINPAHQLTYSNCCVRNIRYVLSLNTSQCLKQEGCQYHRERGLPGELINFTTFCGEMLYNGESLIYDEHMQDANKCRVFCRTPGDIHDDDDDIDDEGGDDKDGDDNDGDDEDGDDDVYDGNDDGYDYTGDFGLSVSFQYPAPDGIDCHNPGEPRKVCLRGQCVPRSTLYAETTTPAN